MGPNPCVQPTGDGEDLRQDRDEREADAECRDGAVSSGEAAGRARGLADQV